MGYKTFIFDLDGTLSNSKEGITKCVQYALQEFDIFEEVDNLEHFIGPPLREQFIKCYGFSMDQATKATALYRERYIPIGVYETEIYPGVSDTLKQLKEKNVIVALATSKPQEMAETVLKHLGINQYFDFVRGADLNGPIYSKTDVLEALLKDMNIKEKDKSDLVMIGDTNYDVIGAVDVGIDCIGVEYGFGDKEQMMADGAIKVVPVINDILAYV